MKSASAKAKGRRLQQKVRDLLTAHLKLEPGDIESRSSGANGVDLLLSPRARAAFPYDIEIKNVERLNLWTAWAQTEANATLTPLLIVARNGQRPLAILDLEAFLA